MTEEWRPVAGYERYEVSNLGRVRNSAGGEPLKPVYVGGDSRWPQRYPAVHLRREEGGRSKRRTFTVHRLVAAAFLGDPPSAEHQAAHRDGDVDNNAATNLSWKTPAENAADRLPHGTLGRKLEPSDVRAIRARLKAGAAKARLAREYGVSGTMIGYIASRRKWRLVVGDAP